MITLDGHNYFCSQNKYKRRQTKHASTTTGLTGAKIRLETGVFTTRYELTLRCDINDIIALRTTFGKTSTVGTPPANQLNFIDEEGFNWNPAAGSNDATHAYSTGVYFDGDVFPEPIAPIGWNISNYFLIPVTLIVNASGLASA